MLINSRPGTKLNIRLRLLLVVSFKVVLFRVLCNGSSFCGTAGRTVRTRFFKLRLRRIAIVPQFQGHPGSEALIAAVSLSETRRIAM